MVDINSKGIVRILHYIGLLELGGSQTFVMELYRNIDRDKIQFDFVTFPNERGPLYDEILSLGGRVYECPKYKGLNHLQFIRWWDVLLEEHLEYQVVHGHIRSVASIYLPIVRKHGRFAILHSHSASNGKGISAFIKFILQLPVRHQADFYMACSDNAGRWLFGDKVAHSKRYRTVPNAIDSERFVLNLKARERIRKQYSLEDCLVLGHVGRFYEVKNQSFLVDLLNEALKVRDDVRLLLVGDGPLKDEIEDQVEEKGLSNYVVFAGARTDTEDYYNAMDVFVFPSLWEGLGIAVIEAQTSGLPCIISEGVPNAVDINAGLVTKLSLEDGIDRWEAEVLKTNIGDRSNPVTEVEAAGYDIHDNALKMQRFYMKAAERVKRK